MIILVLVLDAKALVLTNLLLKEVGLALQRDVLHEVKWIFLVVGL
jgi:hypothetical protein